MRGRGGSANPVLRAGRRQTAGQRNLALPRVANPRRPRGGATGPPCLMCRSTSWAPRRAIRTSRGADDALEHRHPRRTSKSSSRWEPNLDAKADRGDRHRRPRHASRARSGSVDEKHAAERIASSSLRGGRSRGSARGANPSTLSSAKNAELRAEILQSADARRSRTAQHRCQGREWRGRVDGLTPTGGYQPEAAKLAVCPQKSAALELVDEIVGRRAKPSDGRSCVSVNSTADRRNVDAKHRW